MKIKSIKLTNFKRFTKLKIKEIPETAKLVVMIGPNGCGKSSVFDALKLYIYSSHYGDDLEMPNHYYQTVDYYTKSNQPRYGSSYHKHSHQSPSQRMESYEYAFAYSVPPSGDNYELYVEFHRQTELPPLYMLDKSVHVRTAYRNSPAALPYIINRVHPMEERGLFSLIENDEVFASNYWKLAFQWLERSSEIGEHDEGSVDKFRDETLKKLQDAISRLFTDPQLVLKNLGNPLDGDIFQFDKGTSQRFPFHNLASGEKAVLDLLLDVIVTKAEYDETIICIDEPEAHIHTKLQGQLLKELYNLISDNSQLWIATHSIGMVRKAQDLWRKNPDSVVFLDFGEDRLDFDKKETIIPTSPNPDLWARTYDIALGDLAKLVAPKRIVLCEGTNFDADCYNKIFGTHHPETRFIPIGSNQDVEKANENLIPVIQAVAEGAEILRLRDRDDADKDEIEENKEKGIRTLSHRNIESYLLDDEVLTKFCEDHKIPDKVQDLLNARQTALNDSIVNGKPHDDFKPTAQKVHVTARNALSPTPVGNKKIGFMKNHLAPRIQPGMAVYEQLHKDIFGE